MSVTPSETKQSVRTEARACAGSGAAATAVIGQDGRPLGARTAIDAFVRDWDQHHAAYHQELEVLGIARDQGVETCARILHPIVTGRIAT